MYYVHIKFVAHKFLSYQYDSYTIDALKSSCESIMKTLYTYMSYIFLHFNYTHEKEKKKN